MPRSAGEIGVGESGQRAVRWFKISIARVPRRRLLVGSLSINPCSIKLPSTSRISS
jgi:hypothetical protein